MRRVWRRVSTAARTGSESSWASQGAPANVESPSLAVRRSRVGLFSRFRGRSRVRGGLDGAVAGDGDPANGRTPALQRPCGMPGAPAPNNLTRLRAAAIQGDSTFFSPGRAPTIATAMRRHAPWRRAGCGGRQGRTARRRDPPRTGPPRPRAWPGRRRRDVPRRVPAEGHERSHVALTRLRSASPRAPRGSRLASSFSPPSSPRPPSPPRSPRSTIPSEPLAATVASALARPYKHTKWSGRAPRTTVAGIRLSKVTNLPS